MIPFCINLVFALLVFLLGRIVARALTGLVRRVLERGGVDTTLVRFVCSVLYVLLLAVVAIASLDQLGVETTSAIAVLGAAGLAVGLALQGSLGNLAAGVMIIVFRPYRVGDVVNLAGTIGSVTEIAIFNTILTTGDNREIILPNGTITSSKIENITKHDTRRVDMTFGIGYDDDIRKAKEILERLVSEDERVLPEPAPTIVVGELADSSINILCRPWVKSSDYWGLYWDFMEKVKVAFDEAGISIPFPQRDVHVHQSAA
nr:mechanosensitive ion channel domain-containing protein [Haliangium ochraceum]